MLSLNTKSSNFAFVIYKNVENNLAYHRYTSAENPGEGVAQIFAPGELSLPGKIARGSSILAFFAFLLTSFFFYIYLGVCCFIPPPSHVHL
jgi:hypothetical protein